MTIHTGAEVHCSISYCLQPMCYETSGRNVAVTWCYSFSKQVLGLNLWVGLRWRDELIDWDPADYGDVETITVAASDVWLPQFIVQNSAEDDQRVLRHLEHDVVRLNSSGHLHLVHQDRYTAVCGMNFKYYPFDEQTCEVKVTSWSYDISRLDMTLESYSADTSRFAYNTGWGLVSFSAAKTTQQDRSGRIYPCVIYSMKIRRRPIMPIFYLILPNILINVTAIMSFILPCDSSERCSLGITIYLSMVIYLLLFESLIPVSDVLPLIVSYISVSLVMVASSQVLTIIVLRLHHNGTHDNERTVPHWVRHYVMHGLAHVVFMQDLLVPDEEHERLLRQRRSDERRMEHMDKMLTEKMEKNYGRQTSLTSLGSLDDWDHGPARIETISSRLEHSHKDAHSHKDDAPMITIDEVSSSDERSRSLSNSSATRSPAPAKNENNGVGNKSNALMKSDAPLMSKKETIEKNDPSSFDTNAAGKAVAKSQSPSLPIVIPSITTSAVSEDISGSDFLSEKCDAEKASSSGVGRLSASSSLSGQLANGDATKRSDSSEKAVSESPGAASYQPTATLVTPPATPAHDTTSPISQLTATLVTSPATPAHDTTSPTSQLSQLTTDYTPPKVIPGSFGDVNKKKRKAEESVEDETDTFDPNSTLKFPARRRLTVVPNIENNFVSKEESNNHKEEKAVSSSLTVSLERFPRSGTDESAKVGLGSRFGQKRKSSVKMLGSVSAASVVRRSDLTQNKDLLLYKVLRQLEKFQDLRRKEERQKEVKCEWQQLAMLLDRFAFYLYTFFFIFLWIAIFVSVPNHSEELIR